MPRWASAGLVFLGAFLFLSYHIEGWSIAGPYVDVKGKIPAQDEAVYSHVAIRMATQGDWLTPHFLDRFFLTKPPLAYWLTGASVKAFGISALTLRLPSLIAGALGVMIVFLWVSETRSWWTALLAAVALLTHDLWFRLSRLGLTDALLSLWFLLAMWLIARSPWIVGALCGLALLTKGLAGMMPLIAACGVLVFIDWRRIPKVIAAAVLVAAPWHLYMYFVHQRWFWAEYIGVEILRYAIGTPPQTSEESTFWFYVSRAASPLMGLGLGAAVWSAWKKEWSSAQAMAGMVIAGVIAYQYRNIAYLMPLVPALVVLAGRRLPWFALVAMLGWPSREPAMTPVTQVLRSYCEMGRTNELALVSTSDEFHATVLPLARVRYVFIAPPPEYGSAMLDFRALGITQTVEDFLTGKPPREKLRDWGLPNDKALGTVLLAADADEVARLVAERPGWDFILNGTLMLGREAAASTVRRTQGCRL